MDNYIFKQSSGTMLHFFYEKPNTLKFRKMYTDCPWSKSAAILTDVTTSLHMDMDKNDHVHIIYQNKSGNIIYAIAEDENIRVYEMPKSRTNEIYERHFRIIPGRFTIHFFYVLQKNNMYSLLHHTLNKLEFTPPKIIANLDSENLQYSISIDPNEDLHVFFTHSEHKDTIMYKKFLSNKNHWGEDFAIKCNCTGFHRISSTCDKGGNVFLGYQKIVSQNAYPIMLRQISEKEHFKVQTQDEITLADFPRPFRNVEIAPYLDNLILSITDANYSFIHQIEKNKLTWETPKKLPLANNKLTQFTSNYPFENFYIGLTPSNTMKGAHLPILDKLSMDSSYKNMVYNEILSLKNSISYLEKQLAYKNSEMEKLHVRVKYLESTKK